MAAAVGFAVYEVVTSEAFAVAVWVAVGVVSVLCAAGLAVAARNVVRDRGRLWRPARPAVAAVPQPALPVSVPLAIEAPRPVLTGIVLERELAKVTSREDET